MPMYPIPNVPDSLAREIYAALLTYLPPPPTDTEEARIARDSRAMAAVAALIPENAAEAEIAVSAVATDFQAKHALAAAARPHLTVDALQNLRSMTASMLRQSQNLLRTLRQMQAERRRLEDARYPAAIQRSGDRFSDAAPVPVPVPPPVQPASESPRRVFEQDDETAPSPKLLVPEGAGETCADIPASAPTLALPSRHGSAADGARPLSPHNSHHQRLRLTNQPTETPMTQSTQA